MPTFLSDPSDTFYILLFVMALIAIVLWLRSRDKKTQFGAIAGVAIFALFIICDQAFESPREESVMRIEDISKAINDRNGDLLSSFVSESFEYKDKKKADAKRLAELAKQHNVTTGVWNFDRDRVVEVSDTEIDIVFDGKAEGSGGNFAAHFKTRFVRDPDGKWRLKTFTAYDLLKKEQGPPIDIPGF